MFVMIRKSNCKGFFCLCRNNLCHHRAEYEHGCGNNTFWKRGWVGEDLTLIWLAAGGSPGDEVPVPPHPQQRCALLGVFWAQAPVRCWHLNPSDVFSGGEVLRRPSFKLEAEAQMLRQINPSLDQGQRK